MEHSLKQSYSSSRPESNKGHPMPAECQDTFTSWRDTRVKSGMYLCCGECYAHI
jgi:hypothetical protein